MSLTHFPSLNNLTLSSSHLVQGLLKSTGFFGWNAYLIGLTLCNSYVLLVSFLAALMAENWVFKRQEAVQQCFNIVDGFY
jgi:hypothetical protein